jgi:hypothetical protein
MLLWEALGKTPALLDQGVYRALVMVAVVAVLGGLLV